MRISNEAAVNTSRITKNETVPPQYEDPPSTTFTTGTTASNPQTTIKAINVSTIAKRKINPAQTLTTTSVFHFCPRRPPFSKGDQRFFCHSLPASSAPFGKTLMMAQHFSQFVNVIFVPWRTSQQFQCLASFWLLSRAVRLWRHGIYSRKRYGSTSRSHLSATYHIAFGMNYFIEDDDRVDLFEKHEPFRQNFQQAQSWTLFQRFTYQLHRQLCSIANVCSEELSQWHPLCASVR